MLRNARASDDGQAGFTLIEVAAALAVLAVCLSALLPMLSNGIRWSAEAERSAEAVSLAQSLLAKVGAEAPIREGEFLGQFPGGFSWRVRAQAYGDAVERQQWSVSAYRVSAEVIWQDGERSVALTTLRLGPKAPAP